jgi:hypothetical protein
VPRNLRPLFGWRSNRKTAHSTKTAHSAALIQHVRPDVQRGAAIRRILEHFEKPSDFLRWVDFDGKQVPPELGHLTNTVPLQFIGAWLEAYHLTEASPETDGL